jgi:hypothetical protein
VRAGRVEVPADRVIADSGFFSHRTKVVPGRRRLVNVADNAMSVANAYIMRAVRRDDNEVIQRQFRAVKVDKARQSQRTADREELRADKDQARDPHNVRPKVMGPTQGVATVSLLRHTNVISVVRRASDRHGSVEETRIHCTNVDWCSTALVLAVHDRKRLAKDNRV